MSLPSVTDIMKMKLKQVYEWCKKLGLAEKCKGFETVRQYQVVLLEHLKQTGAMEAKPAVGVCAFGPSSIAFLCVLCCSLWL